MKFRLLILTIFLNTAIVYGQENKSLFLNTQSNYYDSTDFSKSDFLNAWFYVLQESNLDYDDPITPIGRLVFQRKNMIKHWTPNFTFHIFNIVDSAYCFQKSVSVRNASSCVPPNVAGDIIIIGKFILLNTNICLQCKNIDDRRDYCRPVINKILSAVDPTKTETLDDLVKQFPINGQNIKLLF